MSSQPQYSLVWREPEEEVIPLCAANGISQIVWSPLGQGVLTGKYDPDRPPPPGTRATSEEMGGFIDRLMQPDAAARGPAAEADRGRGGPHAAAIRAGLGAARAERCLGDHRRVAA